MNFNGQKTLNYQGNLEWFQDSIIFLSLSGSHAYGTNIEGSDIDIKGICVPPLKFFTGFLQTFEQTQLKDPYDAAVFSVRKFCSLAADNNPNILELLFLEPDSIIFKDPVMDLLIDNRDLFLSKKCRFTYSGYAHSQLKRIKTHRRYLLNPIEKQPTREDFGLPPRTLIPKDQLAAANSAVEKLYSKWTSPDALTDKLDEAQKMELKEDLENLLASKDITEKDIKNAAGLALGFDTNFLAFLEQERRYATAKAEWASYQTWKEERNPIRAAMEAEFGLDLKHAMHLMRLLLTCEEILQGKGLIVKRPDAEWLKSIRAGAMNYDEIIAWADAKMVTIEGLYETSPLRKAPDRVKIDELCREIIESKAKR